MIPLSQKLSNSELHLSLHYFLNERIIISFQHLNHYEFGFPITSVKDIWTDSRHGQQYGLNKHLFLEQLIINPIGNIDGLCFFKGGVKEVFSLIQVDKVIWYLEVWLEK